MGRTLSANHLVKTFERQEKGHKKTEFRAVDDVSIDVAPGEIVGILGPNGAGKTTLLRMLGLLIEPTEGKVFYGGETAEDVSRMKRYIGYLSGNTKLYGRLSTAELLTIIGNIYELSKDEIEKRLAEITKLLSMEEFVDNRIERLSTGQTQRASIARCLMHDPDIYIFDEPTLGLDILSSSAIIDFMKREKERGKTVLYSTHYLEEAEFLCDRVILLNHGRIVREGRVADLLKSCEAATLREVFTKLIAEETEVTP